MDPELKVYFYIAAVHRNHEWRGYQNYVFAKSMYDAMRFIQERYANADEIRLRSIQELKVNEGLFLYNQKTSPNSRIMNFSLKTEE